MVDRPDEQIWGANSAYLSRFDKNAMMEIKKRNDKEGGRREWLANVYAVNGKYSLGEPTYGNYDGILVSPSGIMTKDINVCANKMGSGNGCEQRPEQLVATIHMHPIKTMAEEARRQHFSGVDIASEFIKSRDENQEVVLFLTYPNKSMTSRVNKVKAIVFPNSEVTSKAMLISNPQVDPAAVTVEKRDEVDWIKYQAALKDLGYVEEIEIEASVGAPPSPNFDVLGVFIIGAVVVGGYLIYREWKKSKTVQRPAMSG